MIFTDTQSILYSCVARINEADKRKYFTGIPVFCRALHAFSLENTSWPYIHVLVSAE